MTESEQEQLIRRIVRDTLDRMAPPKEAPTGGPTVAVAISACASLKSVQTIRRLRENGFAVADVGCGGRGPDELFDAARELDVEPVCGCTAGKNFGDGTVAVVAPELSLGDATKLSHGILDDIPAEWMWAGLSRGLRVVASPGSGFSDNLPTPLARIAEQTQRECESLGVRWASRDEAHLALAANVSSGGGKTIHVPSGSTRALITETMVANLAEGTESIIVPVGAVVTPLARDRAKARGVIIRLRR